MKLVARYDVDVPIDFVWAELTDFEAWERMAIRRGAEVMRTDRMAQMLLVMAAEMHVLRDRVKCMEFLLTARGVLAPAELDQFVPSPEQAQVLQ